MFFSDDQTYDNVLHLIISTKPFGRPIFCQPAKTYLYP